MFSSLPKRPPNKDSGKSNEPLCPSNTGVDGNDKNQTSTTTSEGVDGVDD